MICPRARRLREAERFVDQGRNGSMRSGPWTFEVKCGDQWKDGGTNWMSWRVVNVLKSNGGVGETTGCIHTVHWMVQYPRPIILEERRGKVLTSDSIRWSTPSTLYCAWPMTTNASKCMYAVRRDHTEESKKRNLRTLSMKQIPTG